MKIKPVTSKVLFYLLNLTWGLPLNIGGFFVALGLLLTGHKPHRWGPCIYFEVGKNWGGCEWGMVFVTDKTSGERIRNHEMGHALQNCYFGPLMPFLICLPSTLRYWFRRIREELLKIPPKKSYDSIWFEGQATRLGYAYWDALSDCKNS